MPKAVGGWKVCSKCREKKPVREFYKRSVNADGLQYWCKECHRRYNQSKRGKVLNRVANQRYYASEKGKVTKQLYTRSAEGKVTSQRYYEAHCEERRAQQKEYRATEEGKAAISRAGTKRQALKAGAISDLTTEDFALLDARYPVCNYCGHEFIAGHPLYRRTLEHIVPFSRGGHNTFDNVVFACVRCNSSKGDKLPEEWLHRWYEEET